MHEVAYEILFKHLEHQPESLGLWPEIVLQVNPLMVGSLGLLILATTFLILRSIRWGQSI